MAADERPLSCKESSVAKLPRLQRTAGTARLITKNDDSGTRIDKLFQEGAAKLRFPVSGGGHLEAVMINTAGGLTGGDTLAWEFGLAEKGALTLTTQACEKIYKAVDATATEVSTRIRVGAGARLAWLPQETILFDRSAMRRRLDVEIAGDARLLLAETVIFGRAAMGEAIATIRFADHWRIRRDGRLIHAEAFSVGPDANRLLARPALLGGYRAMTGLVLVDDNAETMLDDIRSLIGERGGASFFSGKLVARLVDHDAYSLRQRLVPLLTLLNGSDSMPRVWST